MRKIVYALGVGVGIATLLLAANSFKTLPGTFDPDHTGIISSAWVAGIGLPDAGNSNHGLYLAKDGPTSTNAAAFAQIDGVAGIKLTELGYDVKDGATALVAHRAST